MINMGELRRNKMVKIKYYVVTDDDGDVEAIVRATSKTKAIRKFMKGTIIEGRDISSFLEHYKVEQHKVI